MPIGTDAWTSSTLAVVALAWALAGMASMNAQLRNYDETIAKLRSTLGTGTEADVATPVITDSTLMHRDEPGPAADEFSAPAGTDVS